MLQIQNITLFKCSEILFSVCSVNIKYNIRYIFISLLCLSVNIPTFLIFLPTIILFILYCKSGYFHSTCNFFSQVLHRRLNFKIHISGDKFMFYVICFHLKLKLGSSDSTRSYINVKFMFCELNHIYSELDNYKNN